jgi:hypothetical protein
MRGSHTTLEPPPALMPPIDCLKRMRPLSWMVESRRLGVEPAAVAHQLKAQLPDPPEDESLGPVTT